MRCHVLHCVFVVHVYVYNLSSELICVRNVFLVVVKEIMFLEPEKGCLDG